MRHHFFISKLQQFKVIIGTLIVFFSLIKGNANSDFAFTRSPNPLLEIFSFVAALEGSDKQCSGFFIKPDIVLTAQHCVAGITNIMVYPFMRKDVDSPGISGKVIFRGNGNTDVALIQTEIAHDALDANDFKKIDLRLNLAKNEDFFFVGASPGALPLVSACKDPKLSDSEYICESIANFGQSGSALIGVSVIDGRMVFGVYGVLSYILKRQFKSGAISIAALPIKYLE